MSCLGFVLSHSPTKIVCYKSYSHKLLKKKSQVYEIARKDNNDIFSVSHLYVIN